MIKSCIATVLVALTTLTSCNSRSRNSNPNEVVSQKFIESIQQVVANMKVELPGELIKTVGFQVKASGKDLKTFKDGFIPWVNLEKPKIKDLVKPDEVVLPYEKVTLIIDYPLEHPDTTFLTPSELGFTRQQLVEKISKRYHQIYQQEEESSKVKTVPLEKREGLINRNQTHGKYGVWGHDLSDLDLGTVDVYKTKEGNIVITLGVES